MLQKFREWQDQCGAESIPRKSLVEKVGVELDLKSSGMDRVTLLEKKTTKNELKNIQKKKQGNPSTILLL